MRLPVVSGVVTGMALAASLSFGQQANPLQAFEVVSVRMIPSGQPPTGLSLIPVRAAGRITWTATLPMLANYAYKCPGWRIVGIRTEPIFYRISATMDAATTEDNVRLMFQRMLIERFKLVAHTETRELSGYDLVVSTNRSKPGLFSGQAPPLPDYLKGKPPEALRAEFLARWRAKASRRLQAVVFPYQSLRTSSPRVSPHSSTTELA